MVWVKRGVKDPDYEDIPLGGWVGTVTEWFRDKGLPVYTFRVSEATLKQAHPIYKQRCERDGLDMETMTLDEKELEEYDGEPIKVEPPTDIRTQPLSEDEEEDRIRKVFGLTHDDLIPEVDEDTLWTYAQFLKKHLHFPFEAIHTPEKGYSRREQLVNVLDLAVDNKYDIDDHYGLFCIARQGRSDLELPLAEIQVKSKKNINCQLVDDYNSWFWNYR